MQDTDLNKILEQVKSLEKVLKVSLPDWRWILENANSIWDRCPYQMGEAVKIVYMKRINGNSGWKSCEHFLHDGAVGVVKGREFYKGKFRFELTFDSESYKDQSGVIHPRPNEHTFNFEEKSLAPAYYEQLSCEAL